MSPRLLYLLTVGRRREDVATMRAARARTYCVGRLSESDFNDLESAEWHGYGLRAVPDAAIRRGA